MGGTSGVEVAFAGALVACMHASIAETHKSSTEPLVRAAEGGCRPALRPQGSSRALFPLARECPMCSDAGEIVDGPSVFGADEATM